MTDRVSGESFKSVLSVCANLGPISNQLKMNTRHYLPIASVHPQISILLSLDCVLPMARWSDITSASDNSPETLINLQAGRGPPVFDRVIAMDEEFGRERNWTNVDIEIFAAMYFLSC